MGYCNLPEKLVGPYNQTLFLGCSISNFNCNLGWGAEQSTLNVSLVEDLCSHPESQTYQAFNTSIDTLLQQQSSTTTGKAFTKKSNGDWETNDPTKALHKNIAYDIKNAEDTRDATNIALPSDFKDYGKVCYDNDGNRTYYKGVDPRFLGLPNDFHASGLDILGTPVRFKFNNFNFGGLVSSWKQNGSQGGSRLFDVEIKSFSSLLNGCQLIIGKYNGTVCSEVPDTDQNRTKKNIAMPVPYYQDRSTNPPTFNFLNSNVGIEQGNIPNLFNIFGYLEYQGYKNNIYNSSNINDEGMRAVYIYDALINLLGPANDGAIDNKNPFSPYGAIIARSVRSNGDAAEIDPQFTRLTSSISSADIINSINLTHMGICPNSIGADNYRRCRLKLDISQVPRPPKWLRMQGPVISIMQFISELCDGAGYDFFVDFDFPTTETTQQNISGIIRIRTVSRRQQPKKDQIQAMVDYLTQNTGVSSYSKGKEFTDTNIRTMYVGGKQKRLFQLKSTRLAFKQNALVYNPYANGGNGAFIDYDTTGSLTSTPNQVREPDYQSTRRYGFKILGGAAVANGNDDFKKKTNFATASDSREIVKGNYYDAQSLGEAQGFLGSIGPIGKNIELFKDTICPYFGVGANGLIRPVYFDKDMGQMQIVFQVADIQHLTTLPLSTYNPYSAAGTPNATTAVSPMFLVLENEIRAAGGGLDAWISYCFGNIFTTDISEILYKGFRDKYGWGNNTSIQFKDLKTEFINGITTISDAISLTKRIVNGRAQQINLASLSPHFKSLYNDLSNVHKFFENIANEYYGKQFMVRIPRIMWSRDLSIAYDNNNQPIVLGKDENNIPIYAWEGSGKIYTSHNVSTDGAWEEPGNFIDDTMIIGGARVSSMSDETGKIPCILGYNASLERDYITQWSRQQFLAQLAATRFSDASPHTVWNWEFIMERKFNDSDLQTQYYIPLKHELPPEEYALMEYKAEQLNILDAHGTNVLSGNKYKLYVKAAPSSEAEFLEPYYVNPRAIVAISSPVSITSKHSVDYNILSIMHQDGILRLFKGCSIPSIISDMGANSVGPLSAWIGARTVFGGLGPANPEIAAADTNSILQNSNIFHITANLLVDGDEVRSNDRAPYTRIKPKCAIPMFCALPLELNEVLYGPWINHPGLIGDSIFPDSNDENIIRLELENLVGGIKVNVDESLVPWNYGGMTALDTAIMLRIADDVNYQQVLETGTVQIPGFDNFNLGDIIQYYGANFGGPVINSIQVQIAEGGITTTYNFRTYIRKLGLFNKENADRIKSINQEAIKRSKEINTKLMEMASKGAAFRIL